MKRTFTIALAAAATFAAASPAYAALTLSGNACSATDVSPTADSCAGWYNGNLFGGSPAMRADAKTALATLGYNWSPNTLANTLEILPSISGNIINFAGMTSGLTIIGVHRGDGSESAFFKWNNMAPTDSITLNLRGLSNSTLYVTTFTQVPEPATWALMIAGIGLAGWQLRRRRQSVKVTYA